MNKESTVSVIIPAYNAESYIERGINSVLNQTYKNVELIIFYTERGRNALIETVAYAMFLSAEEK